jgi:hypothetical protein
VDSIVKGKTSRRGGNRRYWIAALLAAAVAAYSCKFVQTDADLLFPCDASKGCGKDGFVCGYDNLCRPVERDCKSTCDGGCCVDNQCIPLERQDETACGYAGQACSSCPGVASCRRGVCVNLSCESNWDQCYLPGSNPDGGCVQGLSDTRCGSFGTICKVCNVGQRCYAGDCIWPGTGQLGDPCARASDCGIQSGVYLDCYSTAPFPGGYCTRYCDPNLSSNCEGVCLQIAENPSAGGICYGGCRSDSDCRDGYACQQLSTGNACIGRCVLDAQCRSIDGYRTGRCGDNGLCCGGPGFACCSGTDGRPQCLGASADGGTAQCNDFGFCT